MIKRIIPFIFALLSGVYLGWAISNFLRAMFNYNLLSMIISLVVMALSITLFWIAQEPNNLNKMEEKTWER